MQTASVYRIWKYIKNLWPKIDSFLATKEEPKTCWWLQNLIWCSEQTSLSLKILLFYLVRDWVTKNLSEQVSNQTVVEIVCQHINGSTPCIDISVGNTDNLFCIDNHSGLLIMCDYSSKWVYYGSIDTHGIYISKITPSYNINKEVSI